MNQDYIDLFHALSENRVSGVSFDEALANSIEAVFGKVPVRVIGLDALIRNKKATGRTKDLADAEALEKVAAAAGDS